MAAGKPPKLRFLLTAVGTRGDVQPLVIIGLRLMQDGHVVRIGVNPAHKDSVLKQGVHFYPVDGFDPKDLMSEQMGDRPGFRAFYKAQILYGAWFSLVADGTYLAATEPLEDGTPFRADVILSSHQQIGALPVAQKIGAALCFFNTYPMVPTREFRHPFGTVFEGADTPETPLFNMFTFWLYDHFIHFGLGWVIRRFRQKLGLTPTIRGRMLQLQEQLASWNVPMVGIWSSNLLPRPKDWYENAVVCGSIDRTGGLGGLPDDLLDFIRAGEPPLFFGFGPGSMANKDQIERSWAAAVGAISLLKRRAILHITPDLRGYLPATLPPDTFLLQRGVPHSELFKHCSIITHHGGPGTLHAALRAGKPNCIVSFVCDNPFWGDRLQKLKLGSHVPSRDVTTDRLVACILQLDDEAVADACAGMQTLMLGEEDGVDVLARELYARLPKQLPVDYDALAAQLPSPSIITRITSMCPPPLIVAAGVGSACLVAFLAFICFYLTQPESRLALMKLMKLT